MCYRIAETLTEITTSFANIYEDIEDKYDKFKEEIRKSKKYDLLPCFFAVTSRSRSKDEIDFSRKPNFFFENITKIFRNMIREENIVPAYKYDSDIVTFSRPIDTIYFWPKNGCFGRRGSDKIPKSFCSKENKENNLIKEVKSFITVGDIKFLIETYRKNSKKYDKFNDFCKEHIVSGENSNVGKKLINKNFIVPEFIGKYANFNYKVKDYRNEKNLPLLNLSTNLLENELDIIYTFHDGEFLKHKKEKLCEEDFSKWLVKFYSFLHENKICSEYNDEDGNSVRNCIKIFYDENKELCRIGGCEIEKFRDNCPYSCDKYENDDYLYKQIDSIKTLIKDIGPNIKFLNREMFKEFKSYQSENKNYKASNLIADMRYYYENYEKFLEKLNVGIAPKEKILENLKKKYEDSQEIDFEENKNDLRILYTIYNDALSEDQRNIIKNDLNFILFAAFKKDNNKSRNLPKNLLYTEKYLEKSNTQVKYKNYKKLIGCYTISKYLNKGIIKENDISKLGKFNFISNDYLSDNKDENIKLIKFLKFIGVGKGIDDLSYKNKGDIGEAIAKNYYQKNSDSEIFKVKNTNKYVAKNFKGYDMVLIKKEDLNNLEEKVDKKELVRKHGKKKIEVKFSTSNEESPVQMNWGEVKLFDKIRGKIDIDDEEELEVENGDFKLFVVYNGLNFFKSKIKIYDGNKIDSFITSRHTSLRINFDEKYSNNCEKETSVKEQLFDYNTKK